MYVAAHPTLSTIEYRLLKALGVGKPSGVWRQFESGEWFVHLPALTPVRTIAFGRTHPPADNVVQTLLLLDGLRRIGIEKTELIIPYFGYARQDRAVESGDSVAGEMLLQVLRAAGAGRIWTLDFHSARLRNASPCPIEVISSAPLLAMEVMKRVGRRDCIIVSPDRGGAERAMAFATMAGKPAICTLVKHRPRVGQVRIVDVEGEITGDTAVIVDDILSTGGTIEYAARFLKKNGIKHLHLCITHPLFAGDAAKRVGKLGFESITVTNTLDLPPAAKKLRGLHVVDASRLIAEKLTF